MTHSAKRNCNKKSINFFILVVIMLLSNSALFAQSISDNGKESITSIEKTAIKQQATSVNSSSNSNFILWFMGSNQTPNSSFLPKGTSTVKQFMSSGTEPNRLLIKAFLKKVVDFETAAV